MLQPYHSHLIEAVHAVQHTTPAFDRELPSVEQTWRQTLQEAVSGGSACVSLEAAPSDGITGHNFTICPSAGEAWRERIRSSCEVDGGRVSHPAASWSSDLDALLGVSPMWSRVPGGRTRPLLTAHYIGEARHAECDAVSPAQPWLLRVHHYCEEPDDGGDAPLRLAGVLQGAEVLPSGSTELSSSSSSSSAVSSSFSSSSTAGTRRRERVDPALRGPTWGARSSRRPFERSAALPCQLELFVPTPRLCAHPLLRARGVARLEALLGQLFGGARSSGFVRAAVALEGAPYGKEATYGELSAEGMVQLLHGIPEAHPLDEAALLVDVGSGVGKLLMATVLLTPARARGIELVAERAARAEAARADALGAGLLTEEEARRVALRHADATARGALDGATHVYMANLCFPEALNRAMLAALAAVPSLRCVATLRDLPLRDAWPADARACRLERVAERLVGMSWADNVAVSYYCCTDSDRRAFEATQAAVQSGTTL